MHAVPPTPPAQPAASPWRRRALEPVNKAAAATCGLLHHPGACVLLAAAALDSSTMRSLAG